MRVPHGGDRYDRTTTPSAERTLLFGSLISNTDVTVTSTLMMSTTTTGLGTIRPPKSPDLWPRRRVVAFCLP